MTAEMTHMSNTREAQSRISARRIVGGVIVLLGVLWVAVPFWFVEGRGMTKATPLEFLIAPSTYIGLLFTLFGLAVVGISNRTWLSAVIVTWIAVVAFSIYRYVETGQSIALTLVFGCVVGYACLLVPILSRQRSH
jgi:uncharacterized RDD family membrane protein YckC